MDYFILFSYVPCKRNQPIYTYFVYFHKTKSQPKGKLFSKTVNNIKPSSATAQPWTVVKYGSATGETANLRDYPQLIHKPFTRPANTVVILKPIHMDHINIYDRHNQFTLADKESDFESAQPDVAVEPLK